MSEIERITEEGNYVNPNLEFEWRALGQFHEYMVERDHTFYRFEDRLLCDPRHIEQFRSDTGITYRPSLDEIVVDRGQYEG